MSPAAAELEARRICREPGPDHAALLAVLDGEVVGDAQAPDGLARRAGGRDPGGRPPAGVPVWRLLQRPGRLRVPRSYRVPLGHQKSPSGLVP